MVKKIIQLALLICLLTVLVSPSLAQAQGGIIIQGGSAQVKFPLTLNFSITAQSNANIVDIRLHYKVEQLSYADVTSEVFPEFNPAARVNASWTWDMRRTGGMPPGTAVQYWWTIRDETGRMVETQPLVISFNDTRYSWRKVTEGLVTIFWYQGDTNFAGQLMSAAQTTLTRLAQETGAQLNKPVEIYIYSNAADLQGAMIFPTEWTGGVTFTRFGTISIGIAANNLAWGSRAMAHELTHLVTNQMIFNAYGDIPVWLSEGLAMYFEGDEQAPFASALDRAISANTLFSVRTLASPFSAFPDQATLGYAESRSIVEFLIEKYGKTKMLDLLNTFHDGAGYDGALMKVYGFDMDGLNQLWRQHIGARS